MFKFLPYVSFGIDFGVSGSLTSFMTAPRPMDFLLPIGFGTDLYKVIHDSL